MEKAISGKKSTEGIEGHSEASSDHPGSNSTASGDSHSETVAVDREHSLASLCDKISGRGKDIMEAQQELPYRTVGRQD